MPKQSHRLLAPTCAIALALVIFAACGGDDDDQGTTPEPSATASTNATDATEPPGDETTTTVSVPPNLDEVSLQLEEVASGLESPVAMAFREGDDRIYAAEQGGSVRVIVDGVPAEAPVLTVDVSTGNEQGLLGLTFSPDGTKLYVNYTDPDGHTHVDEYTMNGDVADTASKRELLFVEQPFPNHNGGHVIFGPDGMLYIGLGDGGAGGDPNEAGQDLSTLLGKILRIDPNGDPYAVPSDNPFVGTDGARGENWMFGLRNPWRFTFDRATGDVWIADVGQNAWEEIDFAPAADAAGANWGWDEREGTHFFEGEPPEGAREPIAERPIGNYCAVIGGYVYRGSAIANFNGAYVFSDNCAGDIEVIVQENGTVIDQEYYMEVEAPTAFGEDAAGELYVVSREGSIFKFVPA